MDSLTGSRSLPSTLTVVAMVRTYLFTGAAALAPSSAALISSPPHYMERDAHDGGEVRRPTSPHDEGGGGRADPWGLTQEESCERIQQPRSPD